MNQTLSTFKFNSYTPIGKQEQKKLAQIVNNLIDIPEATDFLHPVAWKQLQLDDYLDVIRHPMNLYKVQEKLKARQFNTVEEVLDLIQLIWDNCKEYNKEGHFYQLAQKMQKIFKKMIKNYLPSVIYTIQQKPNPLPSPPSSRRFPVKDNFANRSQQRPLSKQIHEKSIQPQQDQSKSQKPQSEEEPEIQQIPLSDKNRFHQRLKLITQQDLANIVLLLQELTPQAFKHISGSRYQIHMDNIDPETFRKLSNKLDEFLDNQKISNGHATKKVKI